MGPGRQVRERQSLHQVVHGQGLHQRRAGASSAARPATRKARGGADGAADGRGADRARGGRVAVSQRGCVQRGALLLLPVPRGAALARRLRRREALVPEVQGRLGNVQLAAGAADARPAPARGCGDGNE